VVAEARNPFSVSTVMMIAVLMEANRTSPRLASVASVVSLEATYIRVKLASAKHMASAFFAFATIKRWPPGLQRYFSLEKIWYG
jgi:hypothetical protein